MLKISFLYRRWFKDRPISPPHDVRILLEDYSEKTYKLSIAQLGKFLAEYEGVAKDKADELARTIIASRNLKGVGNTRRNYLSSNGFFQYLLSHKNHPLKKKDLDENALLTNYFVYTSRRSYLKQKTNHTPLELTDVLKITKNNTSYEEKTCCSIQAIVRALKDGVRVIELDLCPSSDKSDIDVSHPSEERHPHSRTLKKCLEAISETAFVTSHFPVMMILVKHFNDSNLQKKLERRIVEFSKDNKCCALDEALQKPLHSLKKNVIILTKDKLRSANTNDIADYTIVDYKMNLDATIQTLTEDKLEEARESYTRITQQKLLAVYPNSKEDFTSNFDPLIGWTHGAQMVTSNIQDFGKHLWVMQGLFRAQGGTKPTGYVKKPEILLNPDQIFDPTAWRPSKKILKVKVYLGTGWRSESAEFKDEDNSPPDFFAAVEIVGVPADEAREKTVPAMDQWVPLWNQEFTFPLTVPELAMLVIVVSEFDPDRTHDFGGQTCLPVCQLRSGIRSVPLYDRKGKPFRSARLLMRFQFD